MDIQELATHALRFFERRTRRRGEDETQFYTLTDRHPTWVKEMVYSAHEDMMPNDYKYQYVVDTLDALSEGQDPEEALYEIEADVYNYDLLRWLESHGERVGFVDEATRELGHNAELGIIGDIMMGQVQEKQQVWQSVVSSLRERLEAIEMEEPEIFEKRGKKEGRKEWDPRV